MSLTEQTTQALRCLEEIVLETLRQHGISRTALGNKYLLDVSGDTVCRKLIPDRPEGEVPPDVTLCLRALEVCGVDGMEVLGALCPAGVPEVLLSAMPVPGFDRDEEQKVKRRKGYKRRRRLLRAAEKLEATIPRNDPAVRKIWPVRRSDPELGPVYEELEGLEEERHRDRGVVEEVCEEVLARECDSLSLAEAVHRVGVLGIWGSVQCAAQRLHFARDGLVRSTALSKKLGDESLLASQLRRSAIVFDRLGAPVMAKSLLEEVTVRCLADQYRDGVGYGLTNYAVLALNRGEIDRAEHLYLAAVEHLAPGANPAYRVAIAQGVATCREHRGDFEGALKFLASIGSPLRAYNPPDLRAYILHTAANIERRLGRLKAAEKKYWEALQLLEGLGAFREELKLCMDLAVCLTKSGCLERLKKVSEHATRLLPKLSDRKFLQTQAELLILELTSGDVSSEALERLRAKV